MKTEALEVVERQPLSLGSMSDMLKGALGNITKENAEAARAISQMIREWDDRQAQKDFAAAFVALQAEIPKIEAVQSVPNNDGTVRYRFAPFKHIMKQVQPLLTRHGFSVSFNSPKREANTACSVCTLMHSGGHSRDNEFTCRIGSGPPRATESQADGSADSYAKRFALCNALNIVVEGLENDARAEGPTITPQQAADFRRRVKATKSNEEAFLNFAGGVDAYEKISASRWAALDRSLKKKETGK